MSPEYEYVRKLVFFGFMCGVTFSALIVVLVHMFSGAPKRDRPE